MSALIRNVEEKSIMYTADQQQQVMLPFVREYVYHEIDNFYF